MHLNYLWNLLFFFSLRSKYVRHLFTPCIPHLGYCSNIYVDCTKRIWYLWPMWAAKVQASLCICAVSPEPSLLAYTSSESRGTFRQKARSLAPLNGWACAVKICHDGMIEDTNSLDRAHVSKNILLILIGADFTRIIHVLFPQPVPSIKPVL